MCVSRSNSCTLPWVWTRHLPVCVASSASIEVALAAGWGVVVSSIVGECAHLEVVGNQHNLLHMEVTAWFARASLGRAWKFTAPAGCRRAGTR